MRTIRASELGTFLYCRRAWYYTLLGKPNENQAEMAAGTSFHAEHGRGVFVTSLVRLLGILLLLAALGLLAYAITAALIP